jgi:GTP-binding protein
MFEKQHFIKSAFNLNELPKHQLPKVILCGRSNVGKSSFINSFFNRKDLAKVSSTPGKTRSINFYEIDNKFYIVDLPGYGYAKTSKNERKYWSKLISEFMSKSGNINLAIHFIDSRHKPTQTDIFLNNLLHDLKIPYIILLSKADKLNQSEMNSARKNLVEFIPGLNVDSHSVFYSSVKVKGRKEIANLFTEIFYQ